MIFYEKHVVNLFAHYDRSELPTIITYYLNANHAIKKPGKIYPKIVSVENNKNKS